MRPPAPTPPSAACADMRQAGLRADAPNRWFTVRRLPMPAGHSGIWRTAARDRGCHLASTITVAGAASDQACVAGGTDFPFHLRPAWAAETWCAVEGSTATAYLHRRIEPPASLSCRTSAHSATGKRPPFAADGTDRIKGWTWRGGKPQPRGRKAGGRPGRSMRSSGCWYRRSSTSVRNMVSPGPAQAPPSGKRRMAWVQKVTAMFTS